MSENNVKKPKIDEQEEIKLPTNRIIKILQEDLDAKRIGDNVLVIMEQLIKKSIEKCKEKKRRTLFLEDIKDVIDENYEFSYLKDLF
ncbi:hypothetical protein BDAP_001254 [Binucleata daphniae]